MLFFVVLLHQLFVYKYKYTRTVSNFSFIYQITRTLNLYFFYFFFFFFVWLKCILLWNFQRNFLSIWVIKTYLWSLFMADDDLQLPIFFYFPILQITNSLTHLSSRCTYCELTVHTTKILARVLGGMSLWVRWQCSIVGLVKIVVKHEIMIFMIILIEIEVNYKIKDSSHDHVCHHLRLRPTNIHFVFLAPSAAIYLVANFRWYFEGQICVWLILS